jgi:hypothetical protein
MIVVALLLALAASGSAAPARAAGTPAEIKIRLWPNPNSVAPGDVLRYDVTIANEGDGKASRTRMTLPFPGDRMSVAKVEFSHKTTWVMELSEDQIVVMFGTLRRGEERTAKLFFNVSADAGGGQFAQRATVRYDEDEGVRVRSNEVHITIGGAQAPVQPHVTIEPLAATPGTRLHVAVDGYYPKEKLFTWLNAAEGALATGVQSVASDQGRGEFELDTRKLKPGSYTLVVLGDSSAITTVTPFELRED